MKQKMISFLCAALTGAALLCGCQKSPETSAVISKNDGAFDVGGIVSASETRAPEATETVHIEETFASTDGSVEFQLCIHQDISAASMPVVEVAPHYLTGEDAERVACSLFGEDAVFYEAEPLYAPIYSKNEIQDKIARWAPNGGDGGVVDQFIARYNLLLETAPEENPHIPCQWTFKREIDYYYSEEEANAQSTSDDNHEIQARVTVNGIPYLFSASTRNKSDFKLNRIYAKPDDGESPWGIDQQIFNSQLCQTEKPDENTLETMKEKAGHMLENMALGQWMIDECYVETTGSSAKPEYIIHINAVPLFENTAALRRPQLENLKSKETYASNYYFTDAEFQFSATGGLVYFSMNSPVDVLSVISSNVQVLSLEELVQLAKNHLALSDYYAYDTFGLAERVEEEMECKVDISSVDYGLTRVKVPNTDESYYYVPAMLFGGTVELCGKQSGSIFYTRQSDTAQSPLLILNAVDGSVINTTNS